MGVAVVHLRSGSRCGLRSKVGVEKGAPVSSTCGIQPLTFYRTPNHQMFRPRRQPVSSVLLVIASPPCDAAFKS